MSEGGSGSPACPARRGGDRATGGTRRRRRPPFHGASCPAALVWMLAGLAGLELLLTAAYWVQGATRPGYDWLEASISSLSLGPYGWLAQLTGIALGTVCIASASAWRLALHSGRSADAYAACKATAGLGLIAVSVFDQDPIAAYPAGGPVLAEPTLHATLHQVAAGIAVTALAASVFVLGRRLAREVHWGFPWGVYARVTAAFTLALMSLYWVVQYSSDIAGLLERIAILVSLPCVGAVVTGRLAAQLVAHQRAGLPLPAR